MVSAYSLPTEFSGFAALEFSDASTPHVPSCADFRLIGQAVSELHFVCVPTSNR
jgi:hypothetical protein